MAIGHIVKNIEAFVWIFQGKPIKTYFNKVDYENLSGINKFGNNIKGTLMQIWKYVNIFVFIWK